MSPLNTRRLRVLAMLLATSALLACATQPRVQTDFDAATDFSSYRTFGWIADTALIAARDSDTPVSALNIDRIQSAIERNLTARGYEYRERGADFTVSFTVGARDTIEIDSFPPAYRGRWWHEWPYYGTRIREQREGHLSIDIFDGRTRRPVWFGSVSRNITGADERDPVTAINNGVALVLEKFPPR